MLATQKSRTFWVTPNAIGAALKYLDISRKKYFIMASKVMLVKIGK